MITRIPSLGRDVALDIPAEEVYGSTGALQSELQGHASLYLGLGGDPSLSWGASASPGEIAHDLTSSALSLMDGELGKMKLYHEKKHGNGWMYRSAVVHRRQPGVTVELSIICIANTSFMGDLCGKDRTLYGIVADVFRAIRMVPLLPQMDLGDINDIFYDHWNDPGVDDEENPEVSEHLAKIQEEIGLFRKHCGHGTNRTFAGMIASIRRRYGRVMNRLSRKQRRWFRFAFEFLNAGEAVSEVKGDILAFPDEEAIPAEYFFAFIWGNDNGVEEEWFEYVNNCAMENGGPVFMIKVSNAADFESAKKVISLLHAAQMFFCVNYELIEQGAWNESK
jgi:hypothetical protein